MKSQTVTLCGSARFESHFHLWNKLLTLSGHTVFGLGCYPSIEGSKDWYSPEEKDTLDTVHKLKISRSDAIVVLNVDGYIGESTLSEIRFAALFGTRIHMLEAWDKGQGLNGNTSPIRTIGLGHVSTLLTHECLTRCIERETSD